MMEPYDEGVTKFKAHHTERPLTPRLHEDLACTLASWRAVLAHAQLIGRDPARYEGIGFGNVSARLGAPRAEQGRRSFLITGTQTGGAPCVDLDSFAVVESYDSRANSVVSHGAIPPSSEAMTHGTIYDLSSRIRFVFHGHCPVIWQHSEALGIPTTHPEVAYGTPEMAAEVRRLHRHTSLPDRRILSMGGHEDGVLAFGPTPREAGEILIATLARAYELACHETGGGLCVT
jgi:ribulose-5-phosphate 4-epimerase/fuculose-1-phosphate aldolase